MSRRRRLLIVCATGLGGVILAGIVAAVVLRQFNLIQPFHVPISAMAPAVSKGDEIYAEGITCLFSKPQRGDIVIFETTGIPSLSPGQIYLKRLVGMPGETLRLTKGVLYVDDQPVTMQSHGSPIYYTNPPFLFGRHLTTDVDTFTVPTGQYFVLGNNSRNSVDSRFCGSIPARAIIGKAVFCYAPSGHFGLIR